MPIRRALINNSNFNLEIAKGAVPGQVSVLSLGENPLVSQSFTDVWDLATSQVLPTSAETLEVVSSSTDDDVGGTGATSVLITTQDNDRNVQIQIVPLDGTTPVVLSGTHLRGGDMIVLTAGGGTTNAGVITLGVNAGATRGTILVGNVQTFSTHFSIPAGKTRFGYDIIFNAPKNESFDVKLLITPFGGATIKGQSIKVYQNTVNTRVIFPFPLLEKTDVVFQAKSLNASKFLGIASQLLEVDN